MKQNRYRIYREGEVHRLKRHPPLDVQNPNPALNGASIEFYDAEVEGRVRILKRYHDSEVRSSTSTLLNPSADLPQPIDVSTRLGLIGHAQVGALDRLSHAMAFSSVHLQQML